MIYKNRRMVYKDDKGEKYYKLLDPYTGYSIDDYLISKSGKILSRKLSKRGDDEYKYRVIYKRSKARNFINLRNKCIPIERYIDELVLFNFVNCDIIGEEDIYWASGKDSTPFFKKYKTISDVYIIHLDGDITNDELSNLRYCKYYNYITHCNKFNRKPIIKEKDKQIMINIHNENIMSDAKIAKMFGISPSGLGRIIKSRGNENERNNRKS